MCTTTQLTMNHQNLKLPQAILCDRDGTLIQDEHFLDDPGRIRWIPGVLSTLKQLHQGGTKILVVSNQSGVARGYLGIDTVEAIHAQMGQDLAASGAAHAVGAPSAIADFYYCPHHPEGKIPEYSYVCNCRKPAPGMFLKAIEEHQLQPSQCWAVGDRLRDLEPAIKLGMKAFLVQTGYGIEAEKNLSGHTYASQITVIPSLVQIQRFLIRQEQVTGRGERPFAPT